MHYGKGTKDKPARLPEEFYNEDREAARAQIDALTLPEMIAILRRGGFDDMDAPHTHVCGFDLRNKSRKGCGHAWQHTEDEAQQDFDAAHTCPNCGRGPWQFKLARRDPLAEEGK